MAQHNLQAALITLRHPRESIFAYLRNPSGVANGLCRRVCGCNVVGFGCAFAAIIARTSSAWWSARSTSETRIAVESVTANSRNNRPTMPPMSKIGVNTATNEMLIESTVNPTSRAPFERRFHRLHSLFEIARNVLDDDDRVIHHEPGRNGQRHQRKIIEAVAEQIHHTERADERCGNHNAGINVARPTS